ncbi:Rha family transcriptional regulator [uncultured Campylobacter sp.]|uniref:Rha family transcriptional regulator n=1 Tax=uncultured Campylobacter sp. TaxID=218934 RepID=UPI0028EB2216|nr:Rha family transcriptional regulator [uncultured Campylobacter sp.]
MSNAVIINNCEVELEAVGDLTYTTSLDIKSVFEKRHADILAQIRRLPQDKFNERNFSLVEYKDKKGESRPYYKISKDGFVLLAMGFTGEKAYKFKIEYINAFNRMADEIKQLKFEAYVNKIAELDAVLIDKTKRHRREISGYKGKLTQANNQIAIMRDKLKIFDDPRFKPITSDHPSYFQLWCDNIDIAGNRNAWRVGYEGLKSQNEKLKAKNDEIVANLLKIQKELEKSYTAIGAVKAYIFDNDEFFMKKHELPA